MKTILDMGKGTEMTFEEVYYQYQPLIKKVSYQWRKLEDVKQIAEIELWKAYEAYDPKSKVSFAHYAQVVINKKLLQINNRNQMQKRKGETVEYDDALKSERVVIDTSIRLDIQNAIKGLPKRERDMLLMSCRGYTQEEMAEIFYTSRSNAYRLLKAARDKIKTIC